MARRSGVVMTGQSTAKSRFKTMPCRRCGVAMQVGSNTRNLPRHVECGIQEAIIAMQQMKAKSGPYFDKWLQGCINSAGRNPRTGGPPTE